MEGKMEGRDAARKRIYSASLCREGILGGYLCVGDGKVVYRTGKITVPDRFRNLELEKDAIRQVTKGNMLCFPTVTIRTDGNEEFKFIVFRRNSFLNRLKDMGIG